MAIWAKNPYFWPPRGSKRGENEFSGKKRKRHVLTFPKTKLHAKNQKILSRGFPGKHLQRDRQRRTRRTCEARIMQLMKNLPWLSEKRAVRSWWKITLVICKARSWWKMYLGYLQSAQCAADDKCTLVIWKALSVQLMENVPCYLQSTQCAADRKCTLVICEARSWWKMYLGYLRSEQYAADEKCTLVI